MSDQERAVKILSRLLEKSFSLARYYRNLTRTFPEQHLQAFLNKLSSRMSQFGFELASEIESYGQSFTSQEAPQGVISMRNRFQHHNEHSFQSLEKCILLNHRAIKSYRKALSKINDGDSREILLRHKSVMEATIKELKNLKERIGSQSENGEMVKHVK